MRTSLARIGYLIFRAVTILGKKGPLEFIHYILRGIYNHRPSFFVSYYYHALFDKGPRGFVKAFWLFLLSPSYREKYRLLLRVKYFFADNPIMAEVAFDLMQSRRANRVWELENSGSPFSVLFITSIGETLSARYQVDNLCEQLNKQGIHTSILYNFEIRDHFEKALKFDILVFQRLLMDADVNYLLSQARKCRAALVFEIDDHLFDASVILSHESVKQSSAERIAAVASYSAGIRETLLACDYFIGTTATLATAATDLERTSFVIRNGLSDRQMALAERVLERRDHQQKADGIIRIGYQPGTRTHSQDFAVALPALTRILEEFPHVKFTIQGLLEMPEAFQPFQERIEEWPYVSWEKLVDVTAQLDVAIAPLEVTHPSNKAKSALKYFEAGLVEVPMVASPTEDFRRAIHSGVNGFLAANDEEWYASLCSLVSDPVLRQQMGQKARVDVLAHYTSEAQSIDTLAVFQDILRDHRSLVGARRMAMMPGRK